MSIVIEIESHIQALVESALPNSHYRRLPPNPEWPAAIWNVASEPETQWSIGGGYDQHDVDIFVLVRDPDEFAQIMQGIRTALESGEYYQFEESSGDSEYEDDPEVYVKYLIVRFRTPRY